MNLNTLPALREYLLKEDDMRNPAVDKILRASTDANYNSEIFEGVWGALTGAARKKVLLGWYGPSGCGCARMCMCTCV